MASPSEFTDWLSTRTWVEGDHVPSDFTDWKDTRTWTEAAVTPSNPTGWVTATTWQHQGRQGWRREDGTWIELGLPQRRVGTEWVYLSTGNPVEPDPPTEGMFVGARVGSGITEDFEGVEGLIGARMGISRTYSPGFPSTPPSSMTADYGKRASWHSLKADWQAVANGDYDATLTSFLNAVPEDHDLILTFAHEPENDNPTGSSYNSNPAYVTWVATYAPRWRAAQSRLYDVVKAVRPQTWFGPVLMNGTFRDSTSSARDWWEWIPPEGKMDFYGLDIYNAYHFPMTGYSEDWYDWPPHPGSNRFQQPLQRFQSICDDNGVPGAIGETATAEDETGIGVSRKVGWMQDAVQWSLDNNYLAFAWFHSFKEGDTGRDMLLDSSPQSLTAWRNILQANPRGVKD